ncbi:hypothetical protein [Geobacter sp. SVR]|uniref:hypothetical protein n=1 Tax=Geobacter sp. SVR TaxID=2495594 RepID=UPI00143EFBFE|nr:hypothetical protein [Geobacter sp. SVR]BCS54779.1 hypothetical protein GSVR_30870 [Geobacter sp. SVR]GCF86413.1 hypothetical protein GSbR_30130 [Geobacter sp. SVR]
MEHKCDKEREFGEITTTLQFFQKAEQRREAREVEMVSTMKQIASQGATIAAHADTLGKHDKCFDDLFGRVHVLETSPTVTPLPQGPPEDDSIVVRVYKSKAGPYILAVLVAGFLVGVGTNIEAVTKIALKIIPG